nr:PREDICTED: plexin-C1 [Anolis carolinensis]|eukprot:XP_016849234.1 PREDICTED: plexin-C1 [Anolis carolinensis]
MAGGAAWAAAWLLSSLSWTALALASSSPPPSPPVLSFPSAIDSLAVAGGKLLVASGPCWYDVSPSLSSKAVGRCQEARNATNSLLLPFGDESRLLLTCWTRPGCLCLLEDRVLGPGASQTFGQELVSALPGVSSAGLMLFNNRSGGEWFLVVATSHKRPDGPASACGDSGSSLGLSVANHAVFIVGERKRKVLDGQVLSVAGEQFLNFSAALLWKGLYFFPYFHRNLSLEPKMLVVEHKLADNQLSALGQAALRCGDRGRILSSSLLEPRGLWVGLFGAAQEGEPGATAVCLFPLQRIRREIQACRFNGETKEFPELCTVPAWPLNNLTSLNHSSLVSVYATIVLNKTVLFLGTTNGQLLKVILDDHMNPNCPEILYEIKEESAVFHQLEFDPVNEDYIYLPSNNKIRRIKVANCSKYISCKECLSALDPHCGWCYLNSSCTLKGECPFSNKSFHWASISYGTDKCLKIYTSNLDRGEISVTASGGSFRLSEGRSSCTMKNAKTDIILCERKNPGINCSCQLKSADLRDKVQVSLISGSWHLTEILEFYKCSSQKTCSECNRFNCTWDARENKCVDTPEICKRKVDCSKIISTSTSTSSKPMNIASIEPAWISTLGKSEVLVIGENFTGSNILMQITGTSSCRPVEIPVTEVLNRTHMKFCLPPSRKEVKSVCIKEIGAKCSRSVPLHYLSLPECSQIIPNITWKSGGRNMSIHGKYLNITDSVLILDDQREMLANFTCDQNSICNFTMPAVKSEKRTKMATVVLQVEKKPVTCITFQYEPDPEFAYYEITVDLEPDLELKIYKKNDKLNISTDEMKVFLSRMVNNKLMNITVDIQKISNSTDYSIIHGKAKQKGNSSSKMDKSNVKVYVKLGHLVREVPKKSSSTWYYYILLLIPIVFVVAFVVTQRKSKQLNRKMSEQLELLEYELRKDIRERFAELQMEQLEVVDNFGTVPFLDYKHFVLRTFFPEPGANAFIFIEDSNEPHRRNPDQKDEIITKLSKLICNKKFLVSLIHTLEKQKTFSVKDRCLFASFLTIALQTNLVYLTDILELLTRDLMDQSSNIQPKLLLRRTESVVEKLLTNWMSVCLSTFLRETVGEGFYLLVTTLNQGIMKGPVDVITCKALYTLNEDWLLWQVTDFKTVILNVVFENIQENESEGITKNIEVSVLDCDTIGQAKEKILQAFLSKNGSLYGLQLSEMGLALQSGAYTKELLDVDSSSVTLEDGITKLNTIGHYEIFNEATIKVFKKEKTVLSGCSDEEYSDAYCHLILPDSEAVKDVQGTKHKGKQKFKVKEMYLTKLLSTKIAVHSVVEKLFRSIWTLPNNKAPVAIKYFFDFLDAQAENKKITDPDVLHIWKTNSLPLRFWVNILKNPQFVFDIKKTPHMDGCLSVIAQAFMDSFSLSEQQLGKEAPTNKLLYAKDIPRYKEEVKAFYKAIKDLPPLSTSEIEDFLTQESKKHENEFNEAAALMKIYQYIAKYFDEILNKLEKERGLEEVQQQLLHIKSLVEEKKKCKWV